MIKILSTFNKNLSEIIANKSCFYSFANVKQVQRAFTEPIQTKFQIVNKEKLNHDCYIYHFKFNGPKFPLKIGHHFRIIKNIQTAQNPEGEQVLKYYTPITSCKDFQNDKIQVLFKIYRPNQDPLHPAGGKFTPHLQKLNVGDQLNVQGPFGKFTYQSPGKVQICKNLYSKTKKVYDVKKLFFIAGGTGITPIYQTLTEIAKVPEDKTQIVLLFCNKTQNDIILRKQLQALQPRLKLYHMLETPPAEWNGLQGRVSIDLLNQICPLNEADTFYLFCGPKNMNMALHNIFEHNYPTSNYHKI